MIDELLRRYNVKFEELEPDERETLLLWTNYLQQGQLTIERIRDSIQAMKNAVETSLIDEPEFTYLFIFKVPNRKHIYLKARLKNYLLLEALLSSPEKARSMMERQIAAMSPTKQ